MDKTTLHNLFSNAFHDGSWLEVLKSVFGARRLLAQAQSILLPNNDKAKAAFELGSFTTSDDRIIGLYKIELKPDVWLERNKVGLRELLRNVYKYDVDGAIIVFVQEDKWRLSFVSEIKVLNEEGEIVKQATEPRRFTYLLGQDEQVRTATDRIAALAGKTISLHDLFHAFSVETLTREFYRELSDWYFWALGQVEFPADAEPDTEKRHATALIRLITRIMFVWFLKEKKLVPTALFDKKEIDRILHFSDSTGSTYYKAILQNLFFATLNTRIGDENRKFVSRQTGVQTFYRYQRFFKDEKRFFELTRDIPFLNGGLFECLDQREQGLLIDCFSNQRANEARLTVPDTLFFSDEILTDLSGIYADKKKKQSRVRGLIHILNNYNFTLEENTPLDQEVALDPEMLGKVFENLLAAFNPETRLTARKQTGSFYTPREIVDYMVDESLHAYLRHALLHRPAAFLEAGAQQTNLFGNEVRSGQLLLQESLPVYQGKEADLDHQLRELLSYAESQPFDDTTAETLVAALDRLTLLDPACGSGAFPMGILQKMVHVLGKLDPDNRHWRERQEAKARSEVEADIRHAEQISDDKAREAAQKELKDRQNQIHAAFDPENNDLDYARKLFLIQNCIYGVDIQPIAVQIAKLRFFISLMVDQKVNEERDNRGILSLPNLETKFVAADSIEKIPRPAQVSLRNLEVDRLEKQLADVRNRHFSARTPETKAKYRRRDQELRAKLEIALLGEGWGDKAARLIASWNPYDQNATASFFDPEWMFGPGLTQGFHLIIGNPPYVQLQKLGEQSARYQKLAYKTFAKTGDLYCLFFERGMELLQPGGVLCYIASNKWLRAGYGKAFRAWMNHVPVKGKRMGEPVHLDQIVDFGDLPVFEATAYPAIVLLKKDRPGKAFRAAIPASLPARDLGSHLHFFETELPLLDNASGWSLAPAADQHLLQKIKHAGVPLGEYVDGRIYYGIKTGLNAAFVINEKDRASLIAEDARSAEVIKPFLAGRDIKRYRQPKAKEYLLFIPWHFPLHNDPSITGASQKAEKAFETQFPAVYKYLKKNKPQLEARNKAETGVRYEWYALQRCAATYFQEFDEEKIVVPAIVIRASYALDRTGSYSNDKTTIIPGGDKYLLGVINSAPCDFFMHTMAPSRANGYFEYKPVNLVQLPVPTAELSTREMIGFLVENILILSESEVSEDRIGQAYLEQVIDACVYELYFPESVAAYKKQVLGPLQAALAAWPTVPDLETARAVWKSLYPPEHPVRAAVYYIDTVPEVRRIQQILKGDGNQGNSLE